MKMLGDFNSVKQLIDRDTTHGSRLVGVSSSQIRAASTLSQQPVQPPKPPIPDRIEKDYSDKMLDDESMEQFEQQTERNEMHLPIKQDNHTDKFNGRIGYNSYPHEHTNGIVRSPQRQQPNMMKPHPKSLQPPLASLPSVQPQPSNGMWAHDKYPAAMNGRGNHVYADQMDKCKEEKPFESVDKPFGSKAATSPMASLFAKPFKVPAIQEHTKKRVVQIHTEAPAQQLPGSGGDVNSILKMMTSTFEPLSQIAATPRTEIEVQQSNKQHVYAGLSQMFPPCKCCHSHLVNFSP